MRIESLKLLQFRNYSEQEIVFNPQVNLFIGQNGQGKSNLLEAIEILLSGQSFRPSSNEDYILKTAKTETAILRGKVIIRNLQKEIETQISNNKKKTLLNGKKVGRSELSRQFSTVVFSPDSLSVVKQGPHERRELIDSLIGSLFQDKTHQVYEYAKCLKTRNKVLKNYSLGLTKASETNALLESVNILFLPLAASLVNTRIQTIKKLSPELKTVLRNILNDGDVDISVDYVISQQSAIDWSPNQVYDSLKTRLVDLQAAELSSGQSLVGAHKHDVRFNFNGEDARFYCSQGQQRAIVLATKVAQILLHYEMHGVYPVLLLDDVFSELDSEKRESFLGILQKTPAQIFLTTTDFAKSKDFGKKEMTVFEITKGIVKTAGWN
jgi:DNA replication and repair protein RecF